MLAFGTLFDGCKTNIHSDTIISAGHTERFFLESTSSRHKDIWIIPVLYAIIIKDFIECFTYLPNQKLKLK